MKLFLHINAKKIETVIFYFDNYLWKVGIQKLRLMSELTEKDDGKAASLYWKDSLYKEHEEHMIDMLCRACYPEEEWISRKFIKFGGAL